MATASSTAAEQVPASARGRAAAVAALPAAVTVAGVAVLLRLLYEPWYLNYDARYALLWARDAWHGRRPDYLADFAPTPHPLQTAASALALPFGGAADEVVSFAVLLCFGALVWLVFRLGGALFHPWVGVVAALVVATRPALHRDAALAYQDVPFAALIVAAVLLEVRRPGRGPAVLALLALAGLLRPEAWALAGLYAAYVWRGADRRGRLAAVALAASAPAVWALGDWLVTGDPLHSLHGTAALAEAVDRRRDLADSPEWTARYLGFALREPALVAVPLGVAFAWRHARRRALVPLAAAAVLLAMFAASPLVGLPLIGRYVRTPAVLLALFYGLAVCGWRMLAPGRGRRLWQGAALVAVAASIAFLPRHVAMLEGLDGRLAGYGDRYAAMREALLAPTVRAAFAACAPLTAGDRRPIPFARWWLDSEPGSVGTVQAAASPLGRVVLLVRGAPRPAGTDGYRRVYRNAEWRVYAAPGCVTRPRA